MSLRRVDRAVAEYTALRPRLLPATDEFVDLITGTIDDAGINYLSVTGRTKTIGSFAAKARALGYRSRAAFKITEIDDRFRFFKPGVRVVDLGLAPGGWTQVAVQRGVTHIVGVDLLPVDPLPPAQIIQMDFTDPACAPRLIELLGGHPDGLVQRDLVG